MLMPPLMCLLLALALLIGLGNSFSAGASPPNCFQSVTAPGRIGSPIICGFNTGQHSMLFMIQHMKVLKRPFAVIVDASDACHRVAFDIGAGSTTTKMWDIKGLPSPILHYATK